MMMTMMKHHDLPARAAEGNRPCRSLAFGCGDAGGAPQPCCDASTAGRAFDGLCVPTTMIAKTGDDDDDNTKNDNRRPAAFMERRFRL